jgi:hypothetical protein
MTKKRAVLITTEFRGVFFGYIKNTDKSPNEIMLFNARNCIYWSKDCKGFLGLAKFGPTSSCIIGAQVEEITLYKITSITLVSSEAEKKWLEV